MPNLHAEGKHTYKSSKFTLYGSTNYSTTAWNQSNTDVASCIAYTYPNYPVTGTDENNRIGRKIQSTSIVVEGFLSLFNNNLDSTDEKSVYENYCRYTSDTLQAISDEMTPNAPAFDPTEQPLKVSIRHMFIEVEPETFDTTTDLTLSEDLWNWFNSLHVYSGTDVISSNQQQVKRESTQYTGTYNIISDDLIYLSLHKPFKHYTKTIPYKRNLNFDGTGSTFPSNKILFEVFIGPTNIYIDYGNEAFGRWLLFDNNYDDINQKTVLIKSTMKLKYNDF